MRKAQLKSYWQDQELSRILIQLSEALNPFPFERLRNAWIYTNVIYGIVFFYPRAGRSTYTIRYYPTT